MATSLAASKGSASANISPKHRQADASTPGATGSMRKCAHQLIRRSHHPGDEPSINDELIRDNCWKEVMRWGTKFAQLGTVERTYSDDPHDAFFRSSEYCGHQSNPNLCCGALYESYIPQYRPVDGASRLEAAATASCRPRGREIVGGKFGRADLKPVNSLLFSSHLQVDLLNSGLSSLSSSANPLPTQQGT
ncbi:hypothetical protein PCANC_25437 [Puccinia coronata f. sp. avenae]|uniref:Uncharacterized protein n=1 Tax=Puccinia coronata f. sp. avenae TaxID=200324 RepID=A0A2N5TMX8_9BASI|nr:hypothetical protein PCANC_25437 [Puccinia coronata f. sp. avenae]